MPAVGTVNRIYTVKLFGTYSGVQTLNVFHYRISIALQPTAEEVSDNFQSEVLAAIQDIVRSNVNYNTVEVIDEMDVANFGTFDIDVSGTGPSTGEAMASFVAIPIRLLRSSRDLRSGWKRFAGVDETSVITNTFTTSFETLVQTAVPDIVQDLNIGLGVLPLVILRNRPTPSTPTIDPEDPTTWLYSDVAEGQFVNRVTTQNSRKFQFS